MTNIIWGTDFKGLAESRLPPKEVGQVHWLDTEKFAQRFAGQFTDTMPSEWPFIDCPFTAPDGDCA